MSNPKHFLTSFNLMLKVDGGIDIIFDKLKTKIFITKV